ncbi:hypothetical protein PFISCL1PPCAC_28974, partial [Pristionchus fissidentatus]
LRSAGVGVGAGASGRALSLGFEGRRCASRTETQQQHWTLRPSEEWIYERNESDGSSTSSRAAIWNVSQWRNSLPRAWTPFQRQWTPSSPAITPQSTRSLPVPFGTISLRSRCSSRLGIRSSASSLHNIRQLQWSTVPTPRQPPILRLRPSLVIFDLFTPPPTPI